MLYCNLTTGMPNKSLLSYNLVENCPYLVVLFKPNNVATLKLAFSFVNSYATG